MHSYIVSVVKSLNRYTVWLISVSQTAHAFLLKLYNVHPAFSEPLVCHRDQTREILTHRTRLPAPIAYQSSQHVLWTIRVCFFLSSENFGLLAVERYLKPNFFIQFFTVARETSLFIERSCPWRVSIV